MQQKTGVWKQSDPVIWKDLEHNENGGTPIGAEIICHQQKRSIPLHGTAGTGTRGSLAADDRGMH